MQEVMAGDGSDGAVVNRRSNGVAVQASGGKGRIVQGDAVSPVVKQPDLLGSRSLHTLDGGADADVPVRQSDAGKFGAEQYGDLLHQAGLDWNAGELSEIGLRVPSNIAENRSMAAPNVTAIPSGSMNAAGPQQTAVVADAEGYAKLLQEVMPEFGAEDAALRVSKAPGEMETEEAAEKDRKMPVSKFKDIDIRSEAYVRAVEEINNRGTQNMLKAYDRRRNHFGLNMPTGDDVISSLHNTFVHDYNGVSLETADAFEKTIDKLSEKYYTSLTRVEVGVPKESDNVRVYASVEYKQTLGTSVLRLNQDATRDYVKLTERIKKLSREGVCVKVADKYLGEYVPTHEFAHTLILLKAKTYENYVGIDDSSFNDVRNEILILFEKYTQEIRELERRKEMTHKKISCAKNQAELVKMMTEYTAVKRELDEKKISKYSMEDPDEFMAEAFTDVTIGTNPSVYSKLVVEILNRFFGRE